MKPISNLKFLYLTSLSNPACDRTIYRAIRKARASSILEVGMGDASRAERMIQVAKKFSGSGAVRYTGVDGFETNPKGLVTLKSCHQRLSKLDVKIQLVPGEIYPSLHRIANSHTRTDLLIISSGYNVESLSNSWFYIPRMLHATSFVFLQDSDDPNGTFKKLSRLEIERMVKQQSIKSVQAA